MAEDEVTKRADELYASVSEMHVCNVKTLEQTFGGDKTMMGRGVSMFLNTNRDVPSKVISQLEAKQFPDLRRTAHTCKGSAGFVGAERVNKVALMLQNTTQEILDKQKAAEDPSTVEASVEVKALTHTLARCVTELLAELDTMTT